MSEVGKSEEIEHVWIHTPKDRVILMYEGPDIYERSLPESRDMPKRNNRMIYKEVGVPDLGCPEGLSWHLTLSAVLFQYLSKTHPREHLLDN